ncbi:MAG TPA: fimbria/pilus outer membrane usher protein [Rhizomicrobium sp.]
MFAFLRAAFVPGALALFLNAARADDVKAPPLVLAAKDTPTTLAPSDFILRGGAGSSLILELWIAGHTDHKIVNVRETGGHIFADSNTLSALGLQMPWPAADANGEVDLATVEGLTAAVDTSNQRLMLDAPPAALPRQLYDVSRAQNVPPAQSGHGAVLRYDLSATDADMRDFGRSLNGGGTFGLEYFTPDWRLTASGFGVADYTGARGARLDTALIFDRPESLTHVSLGDAISITPSFARPIRFAGFEYASDFSLRPDLDTRPLPAFFGQSAVPATVDVFSGAARVYEQSVAPGPFEIQNLPILSGEGTTTIVTRDVLGRETTQTLSLYTGDDLLAPGLESYAVDLGFLRTRYGLDNFGYDAPLASLSYRRGIDQTLTLQSHVEGAPGLALVSGGADIGLGGFGIVGGDIAASGGDYGGGVLLSANANARAGPYSVFASGQSASAHYRDLASLGVGGVAPARQRFQLGMAAGMAPFGTLSLSWIGSKYQDESANDFLTASWTLSLPSGTFIAATAFEDLNHHQLSAQISIGIPIGGHDLASASVASDNGRLSGLGIYDRPANPDGGFGYRFLGGYQNGARGEADATYIGPNFGADGAFSVQSGAPAIRADANGALIAMGGGVFATHDPGDAFALVETGDPNVRVYRENRVQAQSDDQGRALLVGLTPYAPNHVSIEPRDFSFSTVVDKTDMVVRPRTGSGTVVNFRPASHHPLLAQVMRGIGDPVPMGSTMRLDGQDEPLIVGHDGEVFILDFNGPARAMVTMGDAHCRVLITEGVSTGGIPRTEPLYCRNEVIANAH